MPAPLVARLTALLLTLLLGWSAPPEVLAAGQAVTSTKEASQRLADVAGLLDAFASGSPDARSLGAIWRESLAYRDIAQQCIRDEEKRLADVLAEMAIIGEPSGDESLEVVGRRTLLRERKSASSARLNECRLLLLRSEEVAERASAMRSQGMALHLSRQRDPVWHVMATGLVGLPRSTGQLFGYVATQSGWELLSSNQRITLLLLSLFGVALGGLLRPALEPRLGLPKFDLDTAPWLSYSLRRCLARRTPWLLGLAAGSAYLAVILPLSPVPFMLQLPLVVSGYLVVCSFSRALLGPCGDLQVNPLLEPLLATRLRFLVRVLLVLLLIGYLLIFTGISDSLAADSYQLIRAIYLPLLIVNLLLVFWKVGPLLPLFGSVRLRLAVAAIVLGLIGVEWLGYLNLAIFLLGAVVGSVAALGATLFVQRLLEETLDGLDEGRHPWQHRLRTQLGLAVGQRFPGRFGMRLIGAILLWGNFFFLLLSFWGLTGRGTELLFGYLVDGFTLGSLTVVPARLLTAVAVLLVISAATRGFQRQLDRGWLRYTSLDRGAREATVTLSGYLGNGIAILVALSVAGVEFSHLAIIAGALSVGIGFGLQNVVNNFVSGLILLFERPVRTGDWIVVGGTEGYVKQISIRSTIIETFDRADVIVPNSELISQQVTNWMLRDQYGRVKVPVGVAYGSDTRRVKQILLDVAMAHPAVIIDGSLSLPWVLFIRFGDSSLDFELRAYITNVDNRITVISDLNFAIEEAFRREGIEIPFPQRDLHVRSMPGGF